MASRVTAATSKVGKSNDAKKPTGILKKTGAASKPLKVANKETKAKERRSGGNRKTTSKPQPADAGDEPEVAPPTAKKLRKRSPAVPKGARAKAEKTIPLSSSKMAKWTSLPRDSLEYVGAMVDGAVLKLLRKKGPQTEVSQAHLLKLKGRLIAHCQSMKVPPGVPGQYKNIQGRMELEAERLESNQQTLETLQHEVAQSVKSLERMTEEIEFLKEKIFHLKNQLEIEEEESAGKVLFSTDNSLSLELPKSSLEAPLLQDEMLKIPNQEALLEELHTVRSLKATKDMQDLIEQAYAEVDKLSQ